MRNIYSNIFKVNNKNLSTAINCLKKKQLIGVPTETVYGLAGNAYSKEAVKKIYFLKKRPFKNPLIIHYLNIEQLKNVQELVTSSDSNNKDLTNIINILNDKTTSSIHEFKDKLKINRLCKKKKKNTDFI